MGKNNCYKKNWGKDIKKAIREITDSVVKNIYCRTNCGQNQGGFNSGKCCIYVLIVLTLLLSGIGFYSWIIIGMLCLILQFV
ncbi:hypothetical protein [Clostridium gasigenes]|uniref:Uncharacterized protein n=1 Tax=Clostridium gasigenes TaxID=94869 RepID=A0A1H0TYV5_9CLOT|nr:hypothetical protein [Clostridium gasigenes]MBB6624320.1 hypothetical protein [Clostridium gasigenes]MBB6714707.1 hypothetical protein [Clostridium gasigenes]MBU3089225.1 hypothetical protein [Clostridium gasigenes]MBU3105220.1 hypothetical protein [Clostridium gasigenes]MBU3109353.1 hypothetical protein [Clostridium gasigenes]